MKVAGALIALSVLAASPASAFPGCTKVCQQKCRQTSNGTEENYKTCVRIWDVINRRFGPKSSYFERQVGPNTDPYSLQLPAGY